MNYLFYVLVSDYTMPIRKHTTMLFRVVKNEMDFLIPFRENFSEPWLRFSHPFKVFLYPLLFKTASILGIPNDSPTDQQSDDPY